MFDDFLADTSRENVSNAAAAVHALKQPEFHCDYAALLAGLVAGCTDNKERKSLMALLAALPSTAPPVVSKAELVGALVAAAAAPAVAGDRDGAKARFLDAVRELVERGAAERAAVEAAPALAAAVAHAAPVVVAAAAEAPNVAAAAVTRTMALAAAGTVGEALLVAVVSELPALRADGAALITAVLAAHPVSIRTPWAEPFGQLLEAVYRGHGAASRAAMFAVQEFYDRAGFPKGAWGAVAAGSAARWWWWGGVTCRTRVRAGTLTACFVALYSKNIVDADAMMAWKDDLQSSTPGKAKAIIATSAFFTRLAVRRARGRGEAPAHSHSRARGLWRAGGSCF